MIKNWHIYWAAALWLPGSFLHAQSPSPSGSPASAKATPSPSPHGPTIITATDGTTFDQKANIAVFTGSVKVVDPQFTLTSDKLTVYMRHTDPVPKGKAKPTPTPKPTPKPAGSGKTNEGPTEGGGIDHAVADGNVTIRQEKPGENGGPPQVNIGKSSHANFDNNTGNVKLTGWPQLQQGISTHIATTEGTVMYLDNAGHLKTDGPSRTVIQDQPDSPTPAPSATPSATPRSNYLPLGGF